jgi:hypothetical protein
MSLAYLVTLCTLAVEMHLQGLGQGLGLGRHER